MKSNDCLAHFATSKRHSKVWNLLGKYMCLSRPGAYDGPFLKLPDILDRSHVPMSGKKIIEERSQDNQPHHK